MSTKAELRLATYRLLNEDDSSDPTNTTPSNTHFSSAEIDDYVQKAITLLGSEMEWSFQISQAQSVQDQALYELPSDFIAVTAVFLDGTPLTILERGDLKAINSLWQNSPSGTPKYAYKSSNNVVGLYPAPDADHSSLSLQIEYVKIPATLSSDTDIPDVHAAFQLCLPFYAAYMAETKLGNDKKAAIDLAGYETHRKKLMAKVQNWSPDIMRFRWSGDYGS